MGEIKKQLISCFFIVDFFGTPEKFEIGTFRDCLRKIDLEDLKVFLKLLM